MLDNLDKKILYELDQNCRKSFNTVAKKLKVNRNVILYRFNRLKEKGIIKGSFAEINNVALGYQMCRMFIKIGNANSQEQKEITDYLLKEKRLMWFSKVIGKWDLDIVFLAKTLKEFDTFRRELVNKFNRIIEDSEISFFSKLYHYPKDYLLNNKRNIQDIKILELQEKIDFDEIDTKILRILGNDAMISILNIAKELKLTATTIKNRMKNLEKKGIIMGYRLYIDTKALGYQYYKLHINLKNYKQEGLNTFKSYLESNNFMIYINQYIGAEDFEVELHLKSEKEYINFLEKLKEKFGNIIKDEFVIKFYEEYIFRYLPAI